MSLPTLNLGRQLEGALASGHPWIYRSHLPQHDLHSGEWLRLEAGRAGAFGIYDGNGQIGVRLFSREGVPDAAFWSARVDEALALRAGFDAEQTDAYRLIYGEADGLPGLVIDRYGRHAVVKSYAESVEQIVPEVVAALTRALKLRGVVARDARNDGSLRTLWGSPPGGEITVRENGLRLLANLRRGQKTGLYLDQRDNRAAVGRVAAGKRVLDLFSYSGAFGLYALAGGAAHVTDVDTAAAALTDARRNVAANGFAAERHSAVEADVYGFLQEARAAGRRYDLIVLDPPSLARRKDKRRAALRAYRKLNVLALRVLEPGGWLASASCTSQITPEAFRDTLREAAAEVGVRAQIVREAGHARDHPVPLHFPEGRYLKFVLLRTLQPA